MKWLFPDEQSELAEQLLVEGDELVVPELIYIEFGNVVWKRIRAGRLTRELGAELCRTFTALPLAVADARVYSTLALEIAVDYERTFYDSSYLALAVIRDCELVTADERLVNAFRGTVLERFLRLLV